MTRAGLYALGAWVVTPLLLLGAGVVFSRATLTTAYRAPAGGAFTVSRGEGVLRAAYRALIAVTSAYFYISIPVVILAVVGVVGAVIYLFLMVGSIPIRLVVFLALFCLYTLYAVVRSLFTRVRETDPGRALGREDAPGLWSLAHDVARVVSTRPVDAIFAVPGTDVAVTERGGIWKKMRGTAQRYLVVGLGVLPGMTKSQMEAILAHEYGHFSNRDTAGGNLAHQVYASVNQMAFQLARTGQARWYNPAWLFVMGFLRLFLRVTLGASRLQEILADRHSALAYGAQNFASALRHIIHQDLVFRLQVETEVGQAAEGQRSLRNLYTLPSLDAEAQLQKLEEVEAKALEVPTSPYASHPAPKDRLSLLNALPTASEPTADESGPAWELLADPDGLQAEMTSIIQERVGQQAGE